ncbi:ATP-dependent helicase [Vibrio kanaloae]|uniref:UvrD-helicase domain-containing protein n=2 Tax=Vibrio TaxID=662 RepID=UPI0010BEAC92|nr:UvrD-helicase domain-containing protein [Vibrio kanaloae]TKE96099.1 ATP-dependent helicase [Vibrio kanaloae]
MFEFTEEQQGYIESDINRHVFLEACPGSGKTEVVAAKVATEAKRWRKYPGGMAILSFANSATDELKNRVTKYLPIGRSLFPHFLGTFDSFIYKNIVNPLATQLTGFSGQAGDCTIRIIEGTSTLGFRTRWGIARRGNIHAHHYSMDLKNGGYIFDTGDSIKDRELNAVILESWQERDLKETKNRMLAAGYATYRDIEYLALKALTEEKFEKFVQLFAKKYPLIIVDECQDLSFEQLMILQCLSDVGIKLHFVGDLHQAIYGFRDVDPEEISKFVGNNDFVSLELTSNFRSCQNIINLCEKLTGRRDIIGQVTWLEPKCFIAQYDSCPTELISTFEKLCNGYKNNTIISRGHSILQKFQTSASKLNNVQKLALAIKLFDPDDMDALEKSMTLLSEFIRHHLQECIKPNSFNCPQGIDSNLAWRRFLCSSLKYFTNNNLKQMTGSWSNWVRSAKTLVRNLSSQKFIIQEIAQVISPLNNVNLASPSGQAGNQVDTFLGQTTKTTTLHRKTTIHGAKGETHDVTMLISTARAGGQPGSHWRSWIDSQSSEAARFAYVASSRPKHCLIWAVKTLNDADKTRLKDMGFHLL